MKKKLSDIIQYVITLRILKQLLPRYPPSVNIIIGSSKAKRGFLSFIKKYRKGNLSSPYFASRDVNFGVLDPAIEKCRSKYIFFQSVS